MKILHTADWHLGKRSRRIDRAPDLRRLVEQVFSMCEEQRVDVLLIAGDLFDQGGWNDEVCTAVEHLRQTAQPFLRRGGTVLAVIGNHDREVVSNTLRHALGLADPSDDRHGQRWATGRFHLATQPTFLRLPSRDGGEVQFVLMPYPTAGRYLDDSEPPYGGPDGKRRRLRERFVETLARMRTDDRFDPRLQTVLLSHIGIAGARFSNQRELSEADGVTISTDSLGSGWAYVALGDIHKPQTLGGRANVRYSGSLDRIDIDERDDTKGAVLVEIGPDGLRGEPTVLPLDATPWLDLVITDPAVELPALEERYRAVDPRTLVRCRVSARRGRDDPDAIRQRLEALFPRLYELAFLDEGESIAGVMPEDSEDAPRRGFRQVVTDYLRQRLEGDPDADAVLALAESLLEEAPA